MKTNPPLEPDLPAIVRFRTRLLAAFLVVAVMLAYWNSLRVPFFFDDVGAVTNNPTIHRLVSLEGLRPPHDGSAVTGRPLVNFSLALNYAISAERPWSYHAFNVAIHAAAALTLMALLSGVFATPALQARFGRRAPWLAFVIAVLWALHPLQTETIVSVAQRTESLCALFYLLTLLGFARGTQPAVDGALASQRGWLALSVVSCLLGMATKEVMVTAPWLVLLYDRTFVAGSFGAAWNRRRIYYLALAGTWLLLASLVWSSGGARGAAAGFGLGVSGWSYLLKQGEALVLYLRLSLWPHPLVVDYGTAVAHSIVEVWWQGLIVLGLLLGTGWALGRKPVLGFAGAWFFLLLAPSSSFVPLVEQTVAEHRMYLPLAAVIALLVIGAERWAGRRAFWLIAPALLACGVLTVRRNADYRSEIALWSDTIAHQPDNARAHYNLGHALSAAGRFAAAVPEYQAALRLKPDYAEAQNNLGNALSQTGGLRAAIPHYEEAVRLLPDYANAHYNLGCALVEADRVPEAIAHFETSVRLQPAAAEVRYNLARALQRAGRSVDALAEYAAVFQLRPNYAEALSDRGNLLAQVGRTVEALADYAAAVRAVPSFAGAHVNWANALWSLGRTNEALEHYAIAVRLEPSSGAAHYNFGNALLQLDRLEAAVAEFREAVRFAPEFAGAHHNLALTLVQLRRPAEAIEPYERALQLAPDSAAAHHNFAIALEQVGRLADAAAQDGIAVRLQPDFPEARAHLAALQQRLATARDGSR